MVKTLYVSDLDGTLITNLAVLSDFSQQTLQQLLREGLLFTVASARSVVSMQPILDGLSLPLPIVEFNGAFITDLATGHHEIINSIEPSIVKDLYPLIRQFNCVPFVSTFNGIEDCLYYKDIINGGMSWYIENRKSSQDRRLRSITHLTDSFRDQVVCLTIIDQAAVLTELELAIKATYGDRVETHLYENQYSPGWHWLTVHDQRATKAQAVQTLRKYYGLNDHELVVFGDHNNDIKLFQIANRAIAVQNATPELKGYATHLIDSNEEDSVVKYIHQDSQH
ncbi:HAD hydrolase family protein [Alkalinema pantanalense CENA528]|uniref:HAD hydrolase family protein n=1 Tax=Alkalinema pantanalense TaxID=1620705 RepID=UPI003D6F1C70